MVRTIKSRVTQMFKEGNPLCMHEISANLGIAEKNASGYISMLRRDGLIVKCSEKDSCKWSDVKHNFYNYSARPEMMMKRAEKVGEQLQEEFNNKIQVLEQKYKTKDEEITYLKGQLVNEKTRVKVLTGLLWDFVKDR